MQSQPRFIVLFAAWLCAAVLVPVGLRAGEPAAVEATPEADFDKPGPESMREYAPTIGAVLMLLATHWLMHAGQFVPIRRKLGKPPIF